MHLSFMHLLYTKLLLAEMLSPAPLPIPLLSELNQHPQMGEDTRPFKEGRTHGLQQQVWETHSWHSSRGDTY